MIRIPRALAWIGLCALLLRAQTPAPEVAIRTYPYMPPSTVLHAESNLVETSVAVRDALGRAIGGLHASDFEVQDNGVSQQITGFTEVRAEATAAEAPREPKFVVFFFDDLHMGTRDLPFVKQAARRFIANGVKPGDRLAIVTATGTSGLDFTTDAKLFAEALERLNRHVHIYHTVAEYEADSISTLFGLGSAARALAKEPGERILVMMSSGFIIHIGKDSEHDVEGDVRKVIDAALRCNVVIHAIDAKGLPPTSVMTVNRPMREITQGTGGHMFENTNDIAGAMELAADPEATYQIAFHPGEPDGKFHKLKIRYRAKGAEAAEFRPGYLSRADVSGKAMAARAPMDDAVFSGQTLRDVAASVALAGGQPKDGAIPVSIGVTVDLNQMQFTAFHGRHMQQIVFLMTLLDANGGFVTGKESIMDLALTDEKLASLKQGGLKTMATLDAPPGSYQVRTVVREGVKGALGASTTAVELRAK